MAWNNNPNLLAPVAGDPNLRPGAGQPGYNPNLDAANPQFIRNPNYDPLRIPHPSLDPNYRVEVEGEWILNPKYDPRRPMTGIGANVNPNPPHGNRMVPAQVYDPSAPVLTPNAPIVRSGSLAPARVAAPAAPARTNTWPGKK